jgi:hypothetical protein
MRFAQQYNTQVAVYEEQLWDAITERNSSAMQTAAQNWSSAVQKLSLEFRWLIAAQAAQTLTLATTAALLADGLLRRKLWSNISRVHEDLPADDDADQRFGRQQLLLRLGGFSFFAPVLYFWASRLVPSMIVQMVEWIMAG